MLECACGTGAISKYIVRACKHFTATDFSKNMLEQTRRKCTGFDNVIVEAADITHLAYPDGAFDKVVAGNVIHLLDDPYAALKELERVCASGGKVIIPTYINMAQGKRSFIVKILEKSGAGFKRQFDFDSYKEFFHEAGYEDVSFDVVEGKMPCAIAVIRRKG